MGIPVSSRIPVLNCGSGSEWTRSMSASAPPGLRFGSAVLLAMVFWCAMWTSQCDGVASASPLHRTDTTGEIISVDSRRGDTPQYSEYSTYRPSALLKRSRRISRTFPGTAVGFSRGFSKSLKSSDFHQPCSHVGDLINDVSARAYLAGTVFEGKARSRSSVREPGGTYAVTFSVQHVHKDHSPGTLRLRSQVRLQFREKAGGPRAAGSGPCVQNYNYTGVGLVRANIKRGGKYLVFVSGVGPHNFTVVGEPVFRSKKNLQAVRDVLCHNCVRPVDVWGLRDVTIKVKERLRLVCRCSGNPLPAMLWLKDGARINATRNTRIQYKKKRSSLLIPRVRVEDAGRYECRAISVRGESMATYAVVTVHPVKPSQAPENTTTLWPLVGNPCPIEAYCLNGGTCTYYDTVAELVCQCADGFKGQRCESKDVFNRSTSVESKWSTEGWWHRRSRQERLRRARRER